ncbi:inositol monophosphatase [Rhodobacteraceae bacterium RKSG542]|uniref:inositol monophosphatase family protein n=1 Tax=Pseudovibrio flavus TaxID=2529854 RepID=UPI0012BC96DF|nr:inositol monophosphatase [Pseudovibrio flavus]MTI17628.1 inositol monophosphatase [Pseudovibrio flavus]
MSTHDPRFDFAIELAKKAGAFAKGYFENFDQLQIESKGHHDLVSKADRETEDLVREAIAKAYPEDGILGEERGREDGTSGYLWVIDPIDGTANFVSGIPQWCVIIACVKDGDTLFGVTFEPCREECFTAYKGQGAFLNGEQIKASTATDLTGGAIGIGFTRKRPYMQMVNAVQGILENKGVFFRNASGGLSLCYVASGRLLGFVEGNLQPWDCLAGRLAIEEAGGRTNPVDMDEMLESGYRIAACASGVYDVVEGISASAYVDE